MRMKKLVVFDVDGTLRTQRSPWRHLHLHLGVADKASGFFGMYQSREISYEEWVRLDASLWKGIHRDRIVSALDVNPIRAGAQNLVNWFRQQSYDLLAISTGLDVLNNITCRALGIPKNISNELSFDEKGYCTGEAKVIVTEESKEAVLRAHMAKQPFAYDYLVAVGDSENDVPLFKIADNSLAIIPTSEAVRSAARHCVNKEPIDTAIPSLS